MGFLAVFGQKSGVFFAGKGFPVVSYALARGKADKCPMVTDTMCVYFTQSGKQQLSVV
jgi:hypothetical protein